MDSTPTKIKIVLHTSGKNYTTTVRITKTCTNGNGYDSVCERECCCERGDFIHAALNRGIARLRGSRRYFFVSEHEKFGHDFYGRVGSGCPTGGTNLDELVWADYA